MAKKKTTYEASYFLHEFSKNRRTRERTIDETFVTKPFRSAKAAARHLHEMLKFNDTDHDKWIRYPELTRRIVDVEDGFECRSSLNLADCEDADNILDWFLFA